MLSGAVIAREGGVHHVSAKEGECREKERPNMTITECFQGGKWVVTKTDYDCKIVKEYLTYYRQCWTGTAWGAKEPLVCEPYLGKTRCWDPDENGWVWENRFENDNSMDGSFMTSIITDGLPGTSPSEDANLYVQHEKISPQTSVCTSFDDEIDEEDEVDSSCSSEADQSPEGVHVFRADEDQTYYRCRAD